MSDVHKCHDHELYDIDGDCYSLDEIRQFIMIALGDGEQ